MRDTGTGLQADAKRHRMRVHAGTRLQPTRMERGVYSEIRKFSWVMATVCPLLQAKQRQEQIDGKEKGSQDGRGCKEEEDDGDNND